MKRIKVLASAWLVATLSFSLPVTTLAAGSAASSAAGSAAGPGAGPGAASQLQPEAMARLIAAAPTLGRVLSALAYSRPSDDIAFLKSEYVRLGYKLDAPLKVKQKIVFQPGGTIKVHNQVLHWNTSLSLEENVRRFTRQLSGKQASVTGLLMPDASAATPEELAREHAESALHAGLYYLYSHPTDPTGGIFTLFALLVIPSMMLDEAHAIQHKLASISGCFGESGGLKLHFEDGSVLTFERDPVQTSGQRRYSGEMQAPGSSSPVRYGQADQKLMDDAARLFDTQYCSLPAEKRPDVVNTITKVQRDVPYRPAPAGAAPAAH